MGTHPIFESDFDCLTEMEKFGKSIAIVTGASAGIGKHLCNRLVTDAPDLTVIGLARRPTDMQNKNYFGMTCDVSKASEILGSMLDTNVLGLTLMTRKVSALMDWICSI